MRYIFYYYNDFGTLTLNFVGDGRDITYSYVFYTLRQAIKKFRQDNGLCHKHIKIIKLY